MWTARLVVSRRAFEEPAELVDGELDEPGQCRGLVGSAVAKARNAWVSIAREVLQLPPSGGCRGQDSRAATNRLVGTRCTERAVTTAGVVYVHDRRTADNAARPRLGSAFYSRFVFRRLFPC